LEGVAAARRRLTTRDAVRARHGRLARHQIPWLLQHSAWTAQRFAEADLPPERWWQLPPVGKREMMAHFDALNTVGVRLEEVLALAHEAEDTRDFTGTLTTAAGRGGGGAVPRHLARARRLPRRPRGPPALGRDRARRPPAPLPPV